MKIILIVLALLNLTSCASLLRPDTLLGLYQNRNLASGEEVSKTRLEWNIDPKDKAQMAQYYAAEKECKDFAFKSKVMGSRFHESDIMVSCIKRKGYTTRTVAIK